MTICVAYIYNVIIVPLLRLTQTKHTVHKYMALQQDYCLYVITYIQMIQLTHRKTSTHTNTHQLLVTSVLALSIIKYCHLLSDCFFSSLRCKTVLKY